MRNFKDIILEKLKVSTKQRLESLEDFDFEKFCNSVDALGQIDVTPYLKGGEPIIYDHMSARKYVLDHISTLKYGDENSIIFVFALKYDPKKIITWRKINKEQIEKMAPKLKGGDFLQLIQNIYNDIVK